MAEKKSFDGLMQELEGIVGELEGGELSLDDSIKKYEAGVRILKECYQHLEKTSKRVQKLVKKEDGSFSLEPFEEGGEGEK
jgi:exodeoxyribonuclease VII small subunit